MECSVLDENFTICKTQDDKDVNLDRGFVFLTKTEAGVLVICESRFIPPSAIEVDADWKALKVIRNEDFELAGGVAKIIGILSSLNIEVFFATSYSAVFVFIKSKYIAKSVSLLKNSGCTVDSKRVAPKSAFSISL